jgi:hypothetical protein
MPGKCPKCGSSRVKRIHRGALRLIGEYRQSRRYECSKCKWSGWISLKELGVTDGVRTPRPDDDRFSLKAADFELPEELLADQMLAAPIASVAAPAGAPATAQSTALAVARSTALDAAPITAPAIAQDAPGETNAEGARTSSDHQAPHRSSGAAHGTHHSSRRRSRRTGVGRAIEFLTSTKSQPGKERPRDILLAAVVTLLLMVLIFMGQRACGLSSPADQPQGGAASHSSPARRV